MTQMTIFLETEPLGGFGIIAATFFLVLAAVAYIVFRLLKKTMKLAFRMAIVIVILLIAVAGSVSFWWLGSGKTGSHTKTTQQK